MSIPQSTTSSRSNDNDEEVDDGHEPPEMDPESLVDLLPPVADPAAIYDVTANALRALPPIAGARRKRVVRVLEEKMRQGLSGPATETALVENHN